MKKSARSRKAAKREVAAGGLKVTRRSVKTGLPPGSVVHVGERKTENSRISLMEFTPDGVCEHTPASAADVLKFRNGTNPVWINVYGLHDVSLVEGLGAGWGIDGLTLEDIANTSQAPHVEFHENYIFVVMKTIKFEPAGATSRMKGCEDIPELDIDQISLVLGRGFVMCFHEEETDRLESLRERIRGGNGYDQLKRPDYLAYAVIDMIVDNTFAVLETLGDAVDGLEAEATGSLEGGTAARIHVYRRQLLQLRKAVWPSRALVYRMTTESHALITSATLPFLRDVSDHVIQIVDMLDTQREVVAGILDVYRSGISMRMNEIMKILTIISTIFIPLTFIAGIYGMNFTNMPEITSSWGYPLVWCAFVAIGGGMLLYFFRKKWL